MKNYEIRRADMQGIFIAFDFHQEREARLCYESYFKHAPETDLRHGSKLVIHEWESEAEADKARMDWLESNPCDLGPRPDWVIGLLGSGSKRFGTGLTLRAALDAARSAPKPTVTVIETAEGGK